MKKIFLVGDPSIDWLVYYQPNQTPKGNFKQTKNLENNPGANIQKLPGGVLLLKSFLTRIIEDGDQLITYPDMDIDEISKKVCTHTIAVVKNYDNKNPETLRVDQFLGNSYNSIPDQEKTLHIEGSPSEADLIIVDDAGNGIRNEDNSWINELNKEKQFQIIHKLNWPLKENELIKKLNEKFSKQIIAVINADDLREHGLEISRQLSWDKTIEDFFTTFPHNQELEDLRKCGTIIIRFNLEAAIVMFRVPNADREKKEAEQFDYYFFYDPAKYEGQTMDETRGNMQGLTHAFVAAIGKRLLYPLTQPDKKGDREYMDKFYFLSSIIPGMETAIHFLKLGYITAGHSLKIDYPLQQIFPNESADKKEGRKNLIQFAGISRFMEGAEPHSLLKHLTLNSKVLISSVSLDYVKKGESFFLGKIPVFQTGHFKTYDHEEIESFRSFNKLIKEYLLGNASKPLSIAVFGPPGSGKSFGVKQIAGSEIIKEKIRIIETNLSQLQSYNDLVTLFHESRDINLSGKTPLIFFDEFDSSYNDKPLGWIKYFLAPMQDGVFKDGEKMHPLGSAIFVFAGGISHSFEDFVEPLEGQEESKSKPGITKIKNESLSQLAGHSGEEEKMTLQQFKSLKGPDFISRLKGFINIKGIDQKNDHDMLYSLRRAIVLRSMLTRDYPNLVDSTKNMNIDHELLAALMQINRFKYGARSLEAIIRMSDLNNERSFKKSNLASNILLSLHIDTSNFKKLMKENKIFPPELFEPLAKEIHARWYKKEKEKEGQPQKVTLKEWKDSTDETKESNRGQAMDILRKLISLGYTVTRNVESKDSVADFKKEEMERMAMMEHDRWNEEKISKGWTYGKIRNHALKIHDCLLDWEDLPENIKDYDRDAVKAIPEILKSVGFAVVKEKSDK